MLITHKKIFHKIHSRLNIGSLRYRQGWKFIKNVADKN